MARADTVTTFRAAGEERRWPSEKDEGEAGAVGECVQISERGYGLDYLPNSSHGYVGHYNGGFSGTGKSDGPQYPRPGNTCGT